MSQEFRSLWEELITCMCLPVQLLQVVNKYVTHPLIWLCEVKNEHHSGLFLLNLQQEILLKSAEAFAIPTSKYSSVWGVHEKKRLRNEPEKEFHIHCYNENEFSTPWY